MIGAVYFSATAILRQIDIGSHIFKQLRHAQQSFAADRFRQGHGNIHDGRGAKGKQQVALPTKQEAAVQGGAHCQGDAPVGQEVAIARSRNREKNIPVRS